MRTFYPCLWFDGKAEEAAEFYTALLPNSHVDRVWCSPADTPSGPAGMVLTVEFTLLGNRVQGPNGGPADARSTSRTSRPGSCSWPLILLPFFGSGFVPTGSMPDLVRWFAEFHPFTPIIETVRGLLLGTPIGWSGAIAIGWCVAISLVGFLWAMRLYERDPIR